MAHPGQIVLFPFPETNLSYGKLRPALIIERIPGPFDDWLICMISTKINQQVAGLDEVINSNDTDFPKSGLKKTSLIRVARVAVVEVNLLLGSIGEIDSNRLERVKENLANWLNPQ